VTVAAVLMKELIAEQMTEPSWPIGERLDSGTAQDFFPMLVSMVLKRASGRFSNSFDAR
jgi:hypothetical protein